MCYGFTHSMIIKSHINVASAYTGKHYSTVTLVMLCFKKRHNKCPETTLDIRIFCLLHVLFSAMAYDFNWDKK